MCVLALYDPEPALPIWRKTVVLGIPAQSALPASFVPHHVVDRNGAPLVDDALITLKASTLPELTKEPITTAVPAEVVAVPGTHSVWSVICVEVAGGEPNWRLLWVRLLLSPEKVTFQP